MPARTECMQHAPREGTCLPGGSALIGQCPHAHLDGVDDPHALIIGQKFRQGRVPAVPRCIPPRPWVPARRVGAGTLVVNDQAKRRVLGLGAALGPDCVAVVGPRESIDEPNGLWK